MSVQSITVCPHDGYFCFNIKYCTEKVSVPGFGCAYGNEEGYKELEIVLQNFGCSEDQIVCIFNLLRKRKEGQLDKEAVFTKYDSDNEESELEDDE